MNREIKFRVWNTAQKKMHYLESTTENHNHYLQTGSGGFWLYESISGRLMANSEAGDLLLQFTGLKDKNGKDAYFDDLVHLCEGYGKDGGVFRIEKNEYGEPFFIAADNARPDIFKIGFREYFVRHNYNTAPKNNFEIIGNIYENPELESPSLLNPTQ